MDNRQVLFLIVVEVPAHQELRVGSRSESPFGAESAAAVPQPDDNFRGEVVGNHQVQVAVAVEVVQQDRMGHKPAGLGRTSFHRRIVKPSGKVEGGLILGVVL